ncbi:MAG: hypothetical protein ACREL3_08530 [Gemmatimonadales bacterium]
MSSQSRRSFVRVAGTGAALAAASAAVPLGADSVAAISVGNQTLKGFNRIRPAADSSQIPLPIDHTGHPGGIYVVVYSAALSGLLLGDTLQVMAELQGINQTAELPGSPGTNVQLGTWVSLMTSASGTVPTLAGESYISPPAGANIMSLGSNVGNHYGVPTRVGAVTIPSAGTWYVNVIAYGLCDAFSGLRTDLLTALPGNGQLTVMRFR